MRPLPCAPVIAAPSRRLRPARSAAAAALLVALVLGTGACNAGRPVAAEVHGTAIPAERVDEIVAAFPEGNEEIDVSGAGEGTYATSWGTEVLNFLVQRAFLAEIAKRRHVVVDEADRSAATEQIPSALAVSEDQSSGQAVFDALSEGTRDWLVDLLAAGVALSDDLAQDADAEVEPEEARSYFDENPSRFSDICPAFLVIAPDDLDAVTARLDAGEDFLELSSEVSIDPDVADDPARPGGQDQCAPGAQWEQARDQSAQQGGLTDPYDDLLAAVDGDVVGPYQADEQGNVMLLLAQVETPEYEDVADQVVEAARADGDWRLRRILEEEARGIDVRVDPRFGRWDEDAMAVTPPEGATRHQPAEVEVDLPDAAG